MPKNIPFFMKKDDLKVHIPNDHQGNISVGLICEILRQAHIDKRVWDNL